MQPSSFSSEESIDLRKIIESLLRRWRIIAAVLALSAILGFGYSFLFQPPVYESSGSTRLPPASLDTGLGLTPEGYLALAGSGPVMDSVEEQIGLEPSSGQLRRQFRFSLPPDQTISFTASADSAERAFLLADTWLNTYQRELDDLLRNQFDQMQAQALQETESLLLQLTSARENLARYDLEHEQSLSAIELAALEDRLTREELRLQELMASSQPETEARLELPEDPDSLESANIGGGGLPDAGETDETSPQSMVPIDLLALKSDPAYIEMSQELTRSQLRNLEVDLVNTENRLRELNLSAVPIAESRMLSLEKALAAEPEFLGQPGTGFDLIPNPVYLALRQDLADSKIRLDVEQSEAAILSDKAASLRERIDDLWLDLIVRQKVENTRSPLANDRKEAEDLEKTILELRPEIRRMREGVHRENAARQELESSVATLQAAYDLARTELDRRFPMEYQQSVYAPASTVQRPELPASPVSPQRTRNIALAMFLGLLIGVGAALLVDYYQARPAPPASPAQG